MQWCASWALTTKSLPMTPWGRIDLRTDCSRHSLPATPARRRECSGNYPGSAEFELCAMADLFDGGLPDDPTRDFESPKLR